MSGKEGLPEQAPGVGEMLQAGQVIRPQMTEATVRCLVQQLYGLTVTTIRELNSYVDRNYLVQVEHAHFNPHIKQLWPHGYILKVLNSMDSLNEHVDAEHDMMHILAENNVNCSHPETNLQGALRSRQKIGPEGQVSAIVDVNDSSCQVPPSVHMVRLMTYIPGKILAQVSYTPALLYQAGKTGGALNRHLQDFSHPALTSFKTLWSLKNVPSLADFTYAIRQDWQRDLIHQVLQAWEEEVVPLEHHFTTGVIHGDLNEQNIIVQQSSGQDSIPERDQEYNIAGVIDFGHAQDSCYVYEAVIIIMYMMVESHVVDPLQCGGHVLAGYLSERPLNQWEWAALKVLVAGRFAQSLTIGEYTYSQDPGNEYILVCAKNGWPRLQRLWNTPKEELYRGWREVIQSYEANAE